LTRGKKSSGIKRQEQSFPDAPAFAFALGLRLLADRESLLKSRSIRLGQVAPFVIDIELVYDRVEKVARVAGRAECKVTRRLQLNRTGLKSRLQNARLVIPPGWIIRLEYINLPTDVLIAGRRIQKADVKRDILTVRWLRGIQAHSRHEKAWRRRW
jgi:hypothetical protein